MAALPSVFKRDDHDTSDSFSPLEPGWYEAEIVKTEYKANSKQTGHYLNAQFKILAPEKAAGRVVFELMNLDNPNATAVEIAQRTLAQICEACDIETVEDSVDLHEIPMGIKLKIRPGDANYEPQNQIAKYCKLDEIPESVEESPF